MAENPAGFTFSLSLSVLNHLGRNLYRSFTTVLGEAISNSWDADAKDVWVYIDKKQNNLIVKDNGVGMDALDFQNKFLKIGYSKRKDGKAVSAKKRPFIGRKGIGKLALLSCAARITVISKVKGGDYVGGVIDNTGLDKAITDDMSPQEYSLEGADMAALKKYTDDHKHGTIIRFEGIHEGIKPHFGFLNKVVALYFRFSLIDGSFKIHINDETITHRHLEELAKKTQFVWHTQGLKDPFLSRGLKNAKEKRTITLGKGVRGFIASVETPKDLSIYSTGERVSIDLFVNGRLRETDIVKHLSIAKVAENYLYGQIHIDDLDGSVDRFTTSREGIIADDQKYEAHLKTFRKALDKIIREWDVLRRKYRLDGNPEDPILSKRERKSGELYNVVAGEYNPPKKGRKPNLVDGWVNDLAEDARFNFGSYAECFMSENLIRKLAQKKKISLSKEAKEEVAKWKKVEKEMKGKGNLSIGIRQASSDLGYLSMSHLANLVDKKDPAKEACLARDANEYRPIRDALAHTALLTDVAKKKLTSVFENVRGRVQTLIAGK
ncbi:MAG: ATP-binding protein [Patescibacteria group bacterium]